MKNSKEEDEKNDKLKEFIKSCKENLFEESLDFYSDGRRWNAVVNSLITKYKEEGLVDIYLAKDEDELNDIVVNDVEEFYFKNKN